MVLKLKPVGFLEQCLNLLDAQGIVVSVGHTTAQLVQVKLNIHLILKTTTGYPRIYTTEHYNVCLSICFSSLRRRDQMSLYFQGSPYLTMASKNSQFGSVVQMFLGKCLVPVWFRSGQTLNPRGGGGANSRRARIKCGFLAPLLLKALQEKATEY